MADLSTLDATLPQDTEAESNGANRIRETRAATKGSYAIEHDLTGPHKFLYGAPGVKPAAGIAGRMFWDTTNEHIERDDGAAWNMLHAVQLASNTGANTGAIPISTLQTVAQITVTIATGSRLLVYGRFDAKFSAGALLGLGLYADGTLITSLAQFEHVGDGQALTFQGMAVKSGLAAGSRVMTLKIQTYFTACDEVDNPFVAVLVI